MTCNEKRIGATKNASNLISQSCRSGKVCIMILLHNLSIKSSILASITRDIIDYRQEIYLLFFIGSA